MNVVEGAEFVDAGVEAMLSDSLNAVKQKNTHFASNIGFGFKVSDLAINLDFRYAYNLAQPNDYMERIEIDGATVSGIKASTNMDLHILLGLSYEFGFDLPK